MARVVDLTPEQSEAIEQTIRAVATKLLPRTAPETLEVRVGPDTSLLLAHQPPEPDVAWQVTLGPHALVLRRCDPETGVPYETAPQQVIAIPQTPEPVPERSVDRLAHQARLMTEHLVGLTSRATTALQHVAPSVETEVGHLLSLAAHDDHGAERIAARVAAGLSAAMEFEVALRDAETVLAEHRGRQSAHAADLAAKRASGSIVEVLGLRNEDKDAATLRQSAYPLAAAIDEAQSLAGPFRAAATVLAEAGARASAEHRVATTTSALATLRARVIATRARGLDVDQALVTALERFAQHTGQPVRTPQLYWPTPKDLLSGPALAPDAG